MQQIYSRERRGLLSTCRQTTTTMQGLRLALPTTLTCQWGGQLLSGNGRGVTATADCNAHRLPAMSCGRVVRTQETTP